MGESSNPLAIDTVVLGLQVVGFLILFLLLRRYLFRPVLGVIQERETEIASGLDAAAKARAELARLDEERARVLAEAREQGREQVRDAVKEGEEARERILTEARQELQELRERTRRALELEREQAEVELRRQVVDLALLAADKAVLRRLDGETQRKVIDDFLAELERAR